MSKKTFFIMIITLIGAFLRFYNLQWGQPYPFHPDEHNLAASVERLNYDFNCLKKDLANISISQYLNIFSLNTPNPDCNLNPKFFAYGSFPIYLTYFTSQILNFFFQISNIKYLISNTLILRFYSALASTLTIPLVYLITKLLLNCKFPRNQGFAKPVLNSEGKVLNSEENLLNLKFRIWDLFGIWDLGFGHFAALLAAFTPGLIQAAHFGTTESLLTFFFLAIVYFSLKFYNDYNSYNRYKNYLLLSILFGLALSTKLTSILFLPVPLLALYGRNLNILSLFFRLAVLFILFVLLVLLVVLTTSPYYFLDSQSLRSSLNYESGVALGSIDVFYTRQFINTQPFFFQAQKIFPFALSWPLFILGTFGFLLVCYRLANNLRLSIFRVVSRQVSRGFAINNNQNTPHLLLLMTAFLSYFLPNGLLYAKWTRFMTPIFPFFSIFAAYLLYKFQAPSTKLQINSKHQAPNSNHKFGNWQFRILNLFGICKLGFGIYTIVSTIVFGLSFFSIYTRPDVRFTASNWIYQNIPENSHLLFETANVIDIPIPTSTSYQLQATSYSRTSFNFYDPDINPKLQQDLLDELVKADYIIIPSRRILYNYRRFPQRWPIVNRYYDLLFSGQLGFEKIAEFTSYPSFSFPPITQLLNYSITFPDEGAEESFTVFDHPVIRIYKKTGKLNQEEYRKLLKL